MIGQRIVREGFIAGLIGATLVATWFLLVDLVAGRPFFTPAMLGDALFWGVRDPAGVSQVTVRGETLAELGYSGDTAFLDLAAGEVTHLRIDFTRETPPEPPAEGTFD